jgi:hypothetical protein
MRRPRKRLHSCGSGSVGEIAEVTRDLHGHLKIRLRNRHESLAVAEPYNHLF